MKIRVAYTEGEQDKKKLLEEAAKALFPDTQVRETAPKDGFRLIASHALKSRLTRPTSGVCGTHAIFIFDNYTIYRGYPSSKMPYFVVFPGFGTVKTVCKKPSFGAVSLT